jgi:hypothetical protein
MMRSSDAWRALPLLLAAAVIGCDRSPPPGALEMPHDTLGLALERFAARMPDSLVHRAGACPFECCVYGTWTPTGEVPLRAAPKRSDPVIAIVPPGEAFAADSGFVRLVGISVLVIADTVNTGPKTFQPGDTVAVLDYVGEGFFNVWDGTKVWQVEDFWGGLQPNPDAGMVGGGRDGREWWVHATRKTGENGWLDADSVPRLKGADACGGSA